MEEHIFHSRFYCLLFTKNLMQSKKTQFGKVTQYRIDNYNGMALLPSRDNQINIEYHKTIQFQ